MNCYVHNGKLINFHSFPLSFYIGVCGFIIMGRSASLPGVTDQILLVMFIVVRTYYLT